MSDDPQEGAPEGSSEHAVPQADEALLEDLRDVVHRLDPVPEEALLAARSMLAYLRLDAQLAELTFDSLTDAPLVGVRSQTEVSRRLGFTADDNEVEVQVVAEGSQRRLIGQCVPADEVELTVTHQGPAHAGPSDASRTETVTDDLGRFVVEVAQGVISLRCRWPSTGRVVETAWVRL